MSNIFYLIFHFKPKTHHDRGMGWDRTTEETCPTALFLPLHRMKKEELIFYLNTFDFNVNPYIYACACINMHFSFPICH